MIEVKPSIICLAVLCVCHCFNRGSSSISQAEILDLNPNSDIAQIAQVVCESKSSGKQISRIETPARIVAYLDSLPSDHQLADCGQNYGDSLRGLVEVLSTGNQDACGSEKVTMIKNYHHLFISQVRKHKMQREYLRSYAPKLVRVFFMHYARMLSSLCERSAITALSNLDDSAKQAGEAEQKMEELASKMGLTNLGHGYDSVFLPWSLIENLYIEKDGNHLSQRLIPNGSTKLSIQMQKGSDLEKLKAVCRDNLRPVYARTLLPVVRLVDMGYYPESGQLAHHLASEPTFHKLYVYMQICEFLLPIRVLIDETQKVGEVVILTKQEADQKAGSRGEPELTDGAPLHPNLLVSLESVQVVDTVTESSAYKVGKQMRSVIRNRGKTFRNIASLYMKKLRTGGSELKSKLNNLRLSHGSGSVGQILDEELSKAEAQNFQVDLYEEGDDSEESLVPTRHRRSIKSVLKSLKERLEDLKYGFWEWRPNFFQVCLLVTFFPIWYPLFLISLIIISLIEFFICDTIDFVKSVVEKVSGMIAKLKSKQ